MNPYKKLLTWYGKRAVYSVSAIIIILLAVGAYFATHTTTDTETQKDNIKTVSVKRVSELQGGTGDISVLGTLEAKNEARLEAESSGRVTSVNVKLGDSVRAGTVLATIENSREAAGVLQAQGSYESALAAASQSEVGVGAAERAYTEARINARNTYRTAFTANDSVIRSYIDELFSEPESTRPGLYVGGSGQAPVLTAERVRLGKALEAWRISTESLSNASDELLLLSQAEKNTKDLIALATTLSDILAIEDPNSEFTAERITSLQLALTTARGQLDGTLSALSGARSGVNAAKSGFEQAQIASSNGTVSSADAQVKQALGSLRLAQSSYEKTIIRTPISGTVNAISLKVGTFVGMQAPAAVVSNEGGLEVKAYVTEDDIRDIRVGDSVTIENNVKGVVTQVASALDSVTKKVEIRIGIEGEQKELTNGQSVTIFLTRSTADSILDVRILLPITSIKMTPDGAIIFTLNESNRLTGHSVVLGAIVGDHIVVEEGVTADMRIVLDARGLRSDEEVEIK